MSVSATYTCDGCGRETDRSPDGRAPYHWHVVQVLPGGDLSVFVDRSRVAIRLAHACSAQCLSTALRSMADDVEDGR